MDTLIITFKFLYFFGVLPLTLAGIYAGAYKLARKWGLIGEI